MDKYVDDYLTCPISQQPFVFPVLAEDGNIYEQYYIRQWLEAKGTSPLTREKIGNKLIELRTIRDFILKVLESNMEYNIYRRELLKKNFLYYANNGFYDEIYKITEFDYTEWPPEFAQKFLRECKDENVIKYVIDHLKDINAENNNKFRMLFCILMYASKEIIFYFLDKNPDLKCENKKGWPPLAYACDDRDLDIIKKLVEKGADINYKGENNKIDPISVLFQKRSFGLITEFLANIKLKWNDKYLKDLKINENLNEEDILYLNIVSINK